jgi:hypothetical protein
MNDFRVTFLTANRLPSGRLESATLWVEARSENHAVAEATMLAMGETGNADAQKIGQWLREDAIYSVNSVIETN